MEKSNVSMSLDVTQLAAKTAKYERTLKKLMKLARGCPDHPQYRGRRRSKTDCPICNELYDIAHELEVWED